MACCAKRRWCPEGGPTVNTLPDRLVAAVLAHLDFMERAGTVSLVCRRWRDVCRGEELLATVDVNLWLPNGLPMLPRLRSLAAWLVTTQGGAHVRSLSIAVGLSGLECDEHSRAEAQALLGTCCSACPGLRVLRLDANVSLLLTSWLAALRSLQRLHVTSTRDLELVWSLRGLTALRELHLGGSKIEWHPAVQLPPSLSTLRLGDSGSHRLPLAQLAALPALCRLELRCARCPSPEFIALSSLRSLTCLHLLGYAYVPESLSVLTWLRQLRYESHFSDLENAGEASAGLQVALPRMRHLTCLALSSAALDQGVLSAVAAMPRLRRLYASAEWAVLPAGPWQRRLRWLALGHRSLLASVGQLGAARALERVVVLSVPDCEGFAERAAAWGQLWRWAERCPSLRRLGLDVLDDEAVPGGVLAGALRLQALRPGLSVACSSSACCPHQTSGGGDSGRSALAEFVEEGSEPASDAAFEEEGAEEEKEEDCKDEDEQAAASAAGAANTVAMGWE